MNKIFQSAIVFLILNLISLSAYTKEITSSDSHNQNIRQMIATDEPVKVHSLYYPDQYHLRDFEEDAQGFLTNTGNDSFIVIDNLDLPRQQACNLLLSLDFKETFERPGLFELFWSVKTGVFRERQKGRFIINQSDTTQANSFLIPLCKLYNFSGNLNVPDYQRNITGFRLDYPGNKKVSIRFNTIAFLSTTQANEFLKNNDVITLEPYERVNGQSFTSLDSIIPKILFAFEDGLKRLTIDKGFLIFWLLVIASLIFLLLRSFLTSSKQS